MVQNITGILILTFRSRSSRDVSRTRRRVLGRVTSPRTVSPRVTALGIKLLTTPHLLTTLVQSPQNPEFRNIHVGFGIGLGCNRYDHYQHVGFKAIQDQGTNHSLSVRVMTKSLRYAEQIIITQAGTMKLGLG